MHLPSYKEAKTTDKREYEEKNYKLKEEYKDITINYLNLDKLSEEELSSLYTSYQSFVDNGIGTPTLLLVSNSEVKMFKRGYTNKESLIELLKENKFIS